MLEKLGNIYYATPPEERIYLSVSNKVDAPRQYTFNASIAPTSSPNFETQEIPEVFLARGINGKPFWHCTQIQ